MKKLKYSRMCRSCINKEYGVNLQRIDCVYGEPFPMPCGCCGEMKNIVTDFTITGKVKMIMKK